MCYPSENSRWPPHCFFLSRPFHRFRHRSISCSSSSPSLSLPSPFPSFPLFSSRRECHIARESVKKSPRGSFKISINIATLESRRNSGIIHQYCKSGQGVVLRCRHLTNTKGFMSLYFTSKGSEIYAAFLPEWGMAVAV